MKKIILFASIFLISASCNFAGSTNLGVLKTLDGGGSWQAYNTIEGGKSTIKNLNITELAFDPNNRQTIFASSSNSGMLVSHNSATTWNPILSKISVYDFFIDPNDAKNIYASGTYNDHGRIVRTKDGGGSWEELYLEASSKNSVNTISINTSNSRELYAGLNSGVVIKTGDGGVNWFVLHDFKDQMLKIRYVSASNSIYALLRTKGLARSTDGGVNWTFLSAKLTGTSYFNGDTVLPENVQNFIKMAIDPINPAVIYLTTSKGLVKTTDEGGSWSYLKLPIKASADQPRAIAETQNGAIAFTSIGSTLFKTLDGGASWQTQPLPSSDLVNKIIIDPTLPQITYAGLISR